MKIIVIIVMVHAVNKEHYKNKIMIITYLRVKDFFSNIKWTYFVESWQTGAGTHGLHSFSVPGPL